MTELKMTGLFVLWVAWRLLLIGGVIFLWIAGLVTFGGIWLPISIVLLVYFLLGR